MRTRTTNERKPVIVVQGGQWGSEAKGAIAAHLCLTRDIDYAVRTGAINAGHTVVYKGKRFAMQQIPTGWVNPRTQLVIGAGAYIHPETLWREIDEINAAMPECDVRKRLMIDIRCGLHTEANEGASKDANRHHRIGATGKGCSEAIVSKIRDRNNGCELFIDSDQGRKFREHNMGRMVDTVRVLNTEIDDGAKVLVEGTQGTLLDLHLGPYPFTTSRMTSAANWIAEAGLAPTLQYEVVLVVRTFPIRVAGNSGPMTDEIEWTNLARAINEIVMASGFAPKIDPSAIVEFEDALQVAASRAIVEDRYKVPIVPGTAKFMTELSKWTPADRSVYRVAASELHADALKICRPEAVLELKKLFEMTTVTKKLRRIARINFDDLKYAIAINRPTWIALTFLDYEEPVLSDFDPMESPVVTWSTAQVAAMDSALGYIARIEKELEYPVKMVSTGPHANCTFRTSLLKVLHSTKNRG